MQVLCNTQTNYGYGKENGADIQKWEIFHQTKSRNKSHKKKNTNSMRTIL